MKTATHCETIFTNLFLRGERLTSKEIASALGTSTNSIRSRISELRNKGLVIACVKSGTKDFAYESAEMGLEEIAAARKAGVEGFYYPAPVKQADFETVVEDFSDVRKAPTTFSRI